MKFQCNVGAVDRSVRIALGIVIIAAGVYSGSLWGLLGVIVLLTGVFKYCGLYTILGVSTCKVETTKGGDAPAKSE